MRNYAFIDAQNLNIAIRVLSWKIDYIKFRIYLLEHYNIEKAYMFMGYKSTEQRMYDFLKKAGYIIVFKPLVEFDSKIKGNCDGEMILQAMIDFNNYDRALLITGDGDFYCLIRYLRESGKLLTVLAPSNKNCSSLVRRLLKWELGFVCVLRNKIEYK
ncbi:MAG: NYN domain-containing protein [Candidatus Peregrinibacteria bacterium]|nr:NYN domain-containing protein [Candidatus Peregrinibacteria bacterium]